MVNFEFDSDQLTPSAKENLDQFAKALLDPKLKGQKFEIDGHTDATGTEVYNLGLSERRANAVVSYLTAQGLDPADLVAKGFGMTKLRVTDPYSPQNRRVETASPGVTVSPGLHDFFGARSRRDPSGAGVSAGPSRRSIAQLQLATACASLRDRCRAGRPALFLRRRFE